MKKIIKWIILIYKYQIPFSIFDNQIMNYILNNPKIFININLQIIIHPTICNNLTIIKSLANKLKLNFLFIKSLQ